jgi:hypothetical protein
MNGMQSVDPAPGHTLADCASIGPNNNWAFFWYTDGGGGKVVVVGSQNACEKVRSQFAHDPSRAGRPGPYCFFFGNASEADGCPCI